jgi:hypothetical protein
LLEVAGEIFPPSAQAYSANALDLARSHLSEVEASVAWEEGKRLHLQGGVAFEDVVRQILKTGQKA